MFAKIQAIGDFILKRFRFFVIVTIVLEIY